MKIQVNHTLHDDRLSIFNRQYSLSDCGEYKITMSEFSESLNGYEGSISNIHHRMRFLFRPAEKIEIARTLIILHGHGSNKAYSKFYDPNWNVIIPLDEFGTDGLGSWWLGENGDFRTYNLVQKMIYIMRAYFHFSSLYFWGSSMGGYGAIIHGFASKAFAIYSHIAQTKLTGTEYTDGINSRFYKPIINNLNQKYADLSFFIKSQKKEKSPILFLSQNTIDRPKYVQQHFFPLLTACDNKGLAYSVSMPLINGHTQHLSVYTTVKDVFEANYRKIKKWRIDNKI